MADQEPVKKKPKNRRGGRKLREAAMMENAVVSEDVPDCDEVNANEEMAVTPTTSKKKRKPGILYLSRCPTGMTVAKLREILSEHGKIHRVFLAPAEEVGKATAQSQKKPKKNPALASTDNNRKRPAPPNFAEGWIEFESKRVAKRVAEGLNNTQIGGKKKYKWHDELWNLKYLSRFKWTNLHERLAYDRAIRHQRIQLEVSQSKREADFFAENLSFSERLKRAKASGEDLSHAVSDEQTGDATGFTRKLGGKTSWNFIQRRTDEQIRKAKRKKPNAEKQLAYNKDFLSSLFTSSAS